MNGKFLGAGIGFLLILTIYAFCFEEISTPTEYALVMTAALLGALVGAYLGAGDRS